MQISEINSLASFYKLKVMSTYTPQISVSDMCLTAIIITLNYIYFFKLLALSTCQCLCRVLIELIMSGFKNKQNRKYACIYTLIGKINELFSDK